MRTSRGGENTPGLDVVVFYSPWPVRMVWGAWSGAGPMLSPGEDWDSAGEAWWALADRQSAHCHADNASLVPLLTGAGPLAATRKGAREVGDKTEVGGVSCATAGRLAGNDGQPKRASCGPPPVRLRTPPQSLVQVSTLKLEYNPACSSV